MSSPGELGQAFGWYLGICFLRLHDATTQELGNVSLQVSFVLFLMTAFIVHGRSRGRGSRSTNNIKTPSA